MTILNSLRAERPLRAPDGQLGTNPFHGKVTHEDHIVNGHPDVAPPSLMPSKRSAPQKDGSAMARAAHSAKLEFPQRPDR